MNYQSPRFACRLIDDIAIGVHTSEPPSDEDWEAWLAVSKKALDVRGSIRALVYSHGGGPNSAQRSQVNDLLKDQPQRISVMLDSRIARGAVTALSWFNPKIKGFDLQQFDSAFEHLGLAHDEIDQVRESIEEMLAQLK